jgi:hypothetical protein
LRWEKLDGGKERKERERDEERERVKVIKRKETKMLGERKTSYE